VKRIILSLLTVLIFTTVYNSVSFAECPISYYVSPAGSDSNNCLSAGTACVTIQHAIDVANGTEACPVIIRVAAGAYNEHLFMDSWESLEGGWNSDFNQQWDFENDGLEPDPAYLTVIDGEDNGTCITQLEKSGANIDGLTIQNGRGIAGGIYLEHSHPNITNCNVKDNIGVRSAVYREHAAGGMWNHFSSPTILNCAFVDNSTFDWERLSWSAYAVVNEHSQAMFVKCSFTGTNFLSSFPGKTGSGMVNIYSSPIISECRFKENYSGNYVFAPMVNINSSPVISRCSFLRNRTAEQSSAGMENFDSTVMIINSEFIGNYVMDPDGDGVAISNFNTECTIINSTFADNRYPHGNSPNCGVITNFVNSHSILWNSIVWNNIYWLDDGPDPDFGPLGLCNFGESSTFEVYHSNIDEGGFAGTNGNISQNPMFIMNGWDDNGTENPFDDVWVGGDYHLQPDSLCIDSGTSQNAPSEDIEGEFRPQGFGYDMGAYEYVYDPTIDDVLNFVDEHEDITGIGSGKSADKKFEAFLKMLVKAV
jgi:hypothetical protein